MDAPECNVGDFGCGSGYITWCLALEIPQSECIGIDKFDIPIPPELEAKWPRQEIEDFYMIWSIDGVRSRFKEVIDYVKSGTIEPPANDLFSDIRHLIVDEERSPVFQKGNLVTGKYLSPSFDLYFHLIYCKRVLRIVSSDSIENLNKAVNHIANALKPDGWFCLVEIDAWGRPSNLEGSLKQAGFRFAPPRPVIRPYITLEEYHPQYPYLIYQCQKTSI